MSATLIDGKAISTEVKAEVKASVSAFSERWGRVPGLAVIMVGEDPASAVYVRNKHKACMESGIASYAVTMPEETTEEELLEEIRRLNDRDEVDAILVQLPLPAHIREKEILEAIDPAKDADGFHPTNVGRLALGRPAPVPCTPAGIMEMLQRTGIDPRGKHCVVLGRSDIVGKPMARLLLAADGTVTVCHSQTADLASHTASADILVVAIGRSKFVGAEMIKEGAVVIDVGINRGPDGKLAGDVDFESVAPKAGAITPVPGGVGPMTIAMLLKNTLTLAQNRLESKK